jgi:hypothetical protein
MLFIEKKLCHMQPFICDYIWLLVTYEWFRSFSLAIFIHVCGPHTVDQPNIDIRKLSKVFWTSQPNQSTKVKQYFSKNEFLIDSI